MCDNCLCRQIVAVYWPGGRRVWEIVLGSGRNRGKKVLSCTSFVVGFVCAENLDEKYVDHDYFQKYLA